LEELQSDVDAWIEGYNRKRPHSGNYCFGKTPMQTFLDSKALAEGKILDDLQQQVVGHGAEASTGSAA
jgi:hypothetical protein